MTEIDNSTPRRSRRLKDITNNFKVVEVEYKKEEPLQVFEEEEEGTSNLLSDLLLLLILLPFKVLKSVYFLPFILLFAAYYLSNTSIDSPLINNYDLLNQQLLDLQSNIKEINNKDYSDQIMSLIQSTVPNMIRQFSNQNSNQNSQDKVDELASQINEINIKLSKLESAFQSLPSTIQQPSNPQIPQLSTEEVTRIAENLIKTALKTYNADKIALKDYALESAGASIIQQLTSPSYCIPFNSDCIVIGKPNSVILSDGNVGNCWSFNGDNGYIGIQLSRSITVGSFSIDHVDEAIAHDLTSAPRKLKFFAVNGKVDSFELKNDKFALLADAEYVLGGDNIQTFTVTSGFNEKVDQVVLQVLDNWGKEDFTCVYRVRVHARE